MDERQQHQVVMTNRKEVIIQGVVHVETFDDREILLETDMGSLVLRGEDLHIQQLDLESKRFAVRGTVNSVQYGPSLRAGGAKARTRGLFERLLK